MKKIGSWLRGFASPGFKDRLAAASGRELAALFLLLAGFFYIDKFLLGPFSSVQIHDVFASDFIRQQAVGRLFLKYGFFAWYPGYAGGIPVYAWHHTPFYLLSIISTLVPVWLVYSAVCVSLMALAGWGMFALLEKHFSVGRGTAFAGGVFFALASQVQPNPIPSVYFNYLFPAFFVWCCEAFQAEAPLRSRLLPLAALNILLALSYPILTLPYYPLLHLLLNLMLFSGKELARACAVWCLLWAGYVLAWTPVLYSLYSYIPFASRVHGGSVLPFIAMFKDFLVQLLYYFKLTATRSLTVIPFFAALTLFPKSRRIRGLGLIWACFLFIAVFFGSSMRGLLGQSIFGKMDLSHFSWTLPVITAFTSFLGLDLVIKEKKLQGRYLCVFAAVFCAALILLYSHHRMLERICLANIYGAVFILSLLFAARVPDLKLPSGKAVWAAWLFLALNLVVIATKFTLHRFMALNAAAFLLLFVFLLRELYRAKNNGALSITPYFIAGICLLLGLTTRFYRFSGDWPERSGYQQTISSLSPAAAVMTGGGAPFRAGTVGVARSWAVARLGIETADARGPMFSARYDDLFRLLIAPQEKAPSPGQERYFAERFLLTLDLVDWYPVQYFNYNIAALANIKYFVSDRYDVKMARQAQRVSLEKEALPGVLKPRTIFIYELKGTLPRAFLAGGAAILPDQKALLAALAQSGLPGLSSTGFFEEGDADAAIKAFPGAGKPARGTARFTEYTPDRIRLEVKNEGPALLLVTNNFHPGWQAAVDGAPVKLYRADHAFQAVPLKEPGTHEVTLEFRDPKLWALHPLVLLGFLLTNAGVLFRRRNGNS